MSSTQSLYFLWKPPNNKRDCNLLAINDIPIRITQMKITGYIDFNQLCLPCRLHLKKGKCLCLSSSELCDPIVTCKLFLVYTRTRTYKNLMSDCVGSLSFARSWYLFNLPRNFPFPWNRKILYCFHSSPMIYPTLSQLNPVQDITPHFYKIQLKVLQFR